jgi:hypothetical protein
VKQKRIIGGECNVQSSTKELRKGGMSNLAK